MQPGGVAQTLTAAEREAWYFGLSQLEIDVPVERIAHVEAYPVRQTREARAARKEALIVAQRKRPEHHAELVLAVEDARTEHRADTQSCTFVARTQTAHRT